MNHSVTADSYPRFSLPALAGKIRARSNSLPVRLEWHHEWSPQVNEAFAALPVDPFMDREVVRTLWDFNEDNTPQRIALFRNLEGKPVGVAPLRKHGAASWQLITQYVLPYARLHVLPAYTPQALAALGRWVDCPNILFYETPADLTMLRPEESWVVKLPATYAELMHQTDYAHNDRRCRKHAAKLTADEDRFDLLPMALDCWQQKWAAQGSLYTAKRKDEMLRVFQKLADQGRLKTFSLHDGDALAGMQINVIGADTLYCQVGIAREEYKKAYPGIWGILVSMEWAIGQGFAEVDMLRTSGSYKKAWATPVTRGYRLVRSPLGSRSLGLVLEKAKDRIRSAN